MLRLAIGVLAFSWVLTPGWAHADTIARFGLSGHYSAPASPTVVAGTLSGTMTVDITTGAITDVSFDYSGRPPLIRTRWVSDTYDGLTEIGQTFAGPNGGDIHTIDLFLPTASLMGYAGGLTCSLANPCTGTSKAKYLSYFDYKLANAYITDAQLTELSVEQITAISGPSSCCGTVATAVTGMRTPGPIWNRGSASGCVSLRGSTKGDEGVIRPEFCDEALYEPMRSRRFHQGGSWFSSSS